LTTNLYFACSLPFPRPETNPVESFWFQRRMFAFSKIQFCRAFVLAAGVLFCQPLTAQPRPQSNSAEAHAVQVQMLNVMYHYADNIAVHIRRLAGELVPARGDLPVFDDKNSFTLHVTQAEMAITPQAMANVLNQYVFARKDAPIKDVSIEIDKD